MSEIDVAATINVILAVLIVAVPSLGVWVVKSKQKIKALRRFIDSVDDALVDDNVSEAEYKDIFAKGKELIA